MPAPVDTVYDANHKGNGDIEGFAARTQSNGGSEHPNGTNIRMMPAFGGELQPGPYQPNFRKFGNPAPLGLCAFALTTFVLSLVNANARNVGVPNIVVGLAYAYGGLIQLLAGMWEMAVGSK